MRAVAPLKVRRASAASGRLLTAYTSELTPMADDVSSCTGTARGDLARLALGHGVGGLMPIDDWYGSDGGEILASARRQALRCHLESLAAIRTVSDVLGRASVPWLVFKGPVLAEFMYRRPDQRSYGDLDLLVPAERFEEALVALEGAGATVLDVNWTLVLGRMNAEVRLVLGRTIIDLHWHLLNQRKLRERFPIRIDELFDRSRWIELGGRTVSTLGAADTVVHTSLHAAVAGADRLAWLKDVDRCVRTDVLDWDEVVGRALTWRVGMPMTAILWRAQRLLGTPVPPGVLRALSPAAWRGVLRATQRVSPIERTMPGRSMSRMVARSARETGWMSVVDLVRRSLAAADQRRHRSVSVGDLPGPTSLVYPSGGDAARAAYLQRVRMG